MSWRQETLKGDFTFLKCCLSAIKRNRFVNRIVTGDEKWIHYDNPKRRATCGYPGHASSSATATNIHGQRIMLCIWRDQLGVVYYELLHPNKTITGKVYRRQLMRLSRALKVKRPETVTRHDKVILQHDKARPHVARPVKTYLETLKWKIPPHLPYIPDLVPSDYHLFRSMQHADQHFSNYVDVKNWIDSWIADKPTDLFRRGIHLFPVGMLALNLFDC